VREQTIRAIKSIAYQMRSAAASITEKSGEIDVDSNTGRISAYVIARMHMRISGSSCVDV